MIPDKNSSSKVIDDDALLSALREGDSAVFSSLFLKYYQPLCRFARAMCRHWEIAEEVVSLVFDDLWRRRETLVVKTSLKAYLYGAVRHQAINQGRVSQRRDARHVSQDNLEALVELNNGLTETIRREVFQEFDRILSAMPPQRQLIFRMNRLDGLRYKEIAEVLGISEHTVQAHMVLAVRQLTPDLDRLRNLIKK